MRTVISEPLVQFLAIGLVVHLLAEVMLPQAALDEANMYQVLGYGHMQQVPVSLLTAHLKQMRDWVTVKLKDLPRVGGRPQFFSAGRRTAHPAQGVRRADDADDLQDVHDVVGAHRHRHSDAGAHRVGHVRQLAVTNGKGKVLRLVLTD